MSHTLFVRVDNTDSFGGGTLKAIDPKYPLEDGLTMGTVPNYNFSDIFNKL